MKILRVTRPPIKNLVIKFPQRGHHIFSRLEKAGHSVQNHRLKPATIGNQYLAYGIGALAATRRLCRIEADVIVADNIESALVVVAAKPFLDMPIVFDFIDDYAFIARYDTYPVRHFLIKHLEGLLPKRFDRVIVVDKHKNRYCRGLKIPPDNIALIPNGTDPDRFRTTGPRGETARDRSYAHSKTVLFAGKLNAYYRIETLMQAVPLVLNRFADTRFVFVGDGRCRGSLEALSKALGVDRSIVFTGLLSYEEMPETVSQANVCVFTLPDSSALILYEYMACGKPTVIPDFSTAKMGIRNDIIPQDCLLLTPPSPQGIADGILSLLEDDHLAKRMGGNGRRAVTDSFCWDRLALEYERVLKAAVAAKGKKQ